MNKKDIKEYKRKFDYIIENSKDIDYDWFKNGQLTWIEDEQKYDENDFATGLLSSDMDGNIYVMQDRSDSAVPAYVPQVFKKLPDDVFEWYFKNVSVWSMLWVINRIHADLE